MKIKLRRNVYVILLLALVCGLLLHFVARVKGEKYSHEIATALSKAQQLSETYSETSNLKQQSSLIERILLCGDILLGLGIGLFAFWIFLGGRDHMSVPLLLLLFDIPLRLFL